MRSKMIWFGLFVGSTLGGFIPSLWNAGMFSMWGILFSGIGGVVGIYLGFKLSDD